MDFLQLAAKKIIVFGLANRKSVACAIARVLQEAGAEIIHVVRSPLRKEAAEKLFPDSRVFVCDVENEENIARVRNEIAVATDGNIHGIVHSIAFANYTEGFKPFHETNKKDFLQAFERAVDFAVDGGTFNLNESKTWALEFKDPINSGREMFLKFKLDW